jgi:hypothetical protein
MRILLATTALLAAAPAAAQPLVQQQQLDDLRMQAEAAQRRAIDQQNQLMSLEARLRADQATYDLQRNAPAVPTLRYDPPTGGGVGAPAAATRYPSIPDRALADSNRRVQAAVGNRR